MTTHQHADDPESATSDVPSTAVSAHAPRISAANDVGLFRWAGCGGDVAEFGFEFGEGDGKTGGRFHIDLLFCEEIEGSGAEVAVSAVGSGSGWAPPRRHASFYAP